MSEAPIHRLLDAVEWQELPAPEDTSGRYATHEGVLALGDLKLRCYVLNDGERMFDADDVLAFFEGMQ